jgi:hypothetical protein
MLNFLAKNLNAQEHDATLSCASSCHANGSGNCIEKSWRASRLEAEKLREMLKAELERKPAAPPFRIRRSDRTWRW